MLERISIEKVVEMTSFPKEEIQNGRNPEK